MSNIDTPLVGFLQEMTTDPEGVVAWQVSQWQGSMSS